MAALLEDARELGQRHGAVSGRVVARDERFMSSGDVLEAFDLLQRRLELARRHAARAGGVDALEDLFGRDVGGVVSFRSLPRCSW